MNYTAADLALRGFRVFPLAPGKKYPASEGWQKSATDDAFVAADAIPDGYNIGICTDGFFVLDVDTEKGGMLSFERLQHMGAIPRTFTVGSARGGFHLYFRPRDGERFRSRAYRKMPNGREVYAIEGFPGLDIRADGGLAVGPGSQWRGLPYTLKTDAPFAELPEFIAELARRATPRLVAATVESSAPVDQPGSIDQATAYLLSAEPAVEGQGGDPHTIVVANRCMDLGVSPDTTATLMLEHWNERCSPPWDSDDLLRKVHSAAKSRQTPIGRDIFDHLFDVVPDYVREPLPITSLLGFASDIDVDALIADQRNDILRNMIGPGEFGVLYGPSGSGKSFLALDMAHAISSGHAWHGVKTRRAAVLYQMGEGMRGFKKRVAAIEKARGKFSDHFAWLIPSVDLDRSEMGAAGTQTIIDAVRALKAKSGAEHVVVIIDTLARAMAGDDENSAQDMMHFIKQRAGAVQLATGAAVIPVHHTNKAGQLRGSGSLFGASECILKVETAEGRRSLYVEKAKDGPDHFTLFAFALQAVPLGIDEDGMPVSSCVVEIGASERQRKAEGVALEIITRAIEQGVHLSPKARATNYAGRYVLENQGNYDFTEADYTAALATLLCGPLVADETSVKGKAVARIALRGNTIFDPF